MDFVLEILLKSFNRKTEPSHVVNLRLPLECHIHMFAWQTITTNMSSDNKVKLDTSIKTGQTFQLYLAIMLICGVL